MLGFAPRTVPDTHTHARGDVPATSWGLLGTLWGLSAGTVVWTVRGVCWVGPRLWRAVVSAAVRAWPYRWEAGVASVMLAGQWWAARAAKGTMHYPWFAGATVDGGIGFGFRWNEMHLGPWVWWLLGLFTVCSALAASGALVETRSRHWSTVTVVLTVTLTAVLSTPTGLYPWSLIVGPVAAVLWALLSPAGPDSRVRNRVRQARLVRRWGRRILRASEGHLRVVKVHGTSHLTLLDCTLHDGDLNKVGGTLGYLANELGLSASQLSIDASPMSAQVTLRIKHGDPLAETITSTLTAHTAPSTAPIRIGRDDTGGAVHLTPRGHLLIVGKTGAGKTNIFSLAAVGHVQRGAEVHLIDLKEGIDAAHLAPRCASMAATIADAERTVSRVHDEMVGRLRSMRSEGAKNWAGDALVLAIDEAADVAEQAPDAWRLLVQIARKGRAAGVVLILATQRPTADVLPKTVTGQMDVRWLGRLTPSEAEIAMEGAYSVVRPHELPKVSGRAVLTNGPDGRVIQTDYLPDEAVAAWAAAVPQDVAEATVRRLPKVQAAVLAVVESSPNCTAQEIGDRLGKDRSQMNRDLKSLARNGLVEATNTKPATWRATNKETP